MVKKTKKNKTIIENQKINGNKKQENRKQSKKNKETITKKSSQKSDEKKVFSKQFFLKYKGFTIALIVFFVIILLFVFSLTLEPSESSEEVAYAKAINQEINFYLDYVISEAELEISFGIDEELELQYVESIVDDLKWLKQKNNELLESQQQVLLKVLAFSIFFDEVMNLNDDFTIEVGEPNYANTINYAKKINYSYTELIDEQYLEDITEKEQSVMRKTIEDLGKDYYSFKKSFFEHEKIERRYVESKKIIFLYNPIK